MTKDAAYYLARLDAKAKQSYEKLLKGKEGDAFLEAYDDFAENHSFEALSSRVGCYLNEASAIIRALRSNPAPPGDTTQYDLLWIDRLTNLMGKGELKQVSLTRAEMLDRLHWISSEAFGEDLDEWSDWLAAFEADPPATGYR